MQWLMWVVVGILLVVGVVILVGSRLPKGHTATGAATVPLRPDVLYALLTDVERYPAWRKDVKHVERLPDRNGMPAWIEDTSNGRIPLVFERMERPSLLVARIMDPALPFGGTWTYRIVPADGGSTLTITEDGEIYNPFFRFMARFVFGYSGTLQAYLGHVGAAATEHAR